MSCRNIPGETGCYGRDFVTAGCKNCVAPMDKVNDGT